VAGPPAPRHGGQGVPDPGNALDYHRYAYVRFNPLQYTDPSGHWLETVWDIANIAWDIHEIRQDPGNLWNWGALVVDVGAALLPVVPAGAGMAVHGGKAAKAAVEAASHADEAVDAGRVAGRLGEAVDAVTAARRLQEVGLGAEEAGELIKAIARQSTRGELVKGGTVSLGHFRAVGDAPGYIDWANKHRAVFFNMDEAVWKELASNPEAVWAVNRQFLDDAIEAGAQFHLQISPADVRSGSYFEMEIQYLLERGYQLVQENGEWWLRYP